MTLSDPTGLDWFDGLNKTYCGSNPGAAGCQGGTYDNGGRWTPNGGKGGGGAGGSAGCARTYSCSAGDIDNMGGSGRSVYLNRIATAALAPDWFNAIQGAIQFEREENLLSADDWMGIVNASILLGIQDGYAIFQGASRSSAGAHKWADFFKWHVDHRAEFHVGCECADTLRSLVLLAQRNETARWRPDARVGGATPARQVRESALGNFARQSPISARRVAARMVPHRGSDWKMGASGYWSSRAAIRVSSWWICSTTASMTSRYASVTLARAIASTPVVPCAADRRWPRSAAGDRFML